MTEQTIGHVVMAESTGASSSLGTLCLHCRERLTIGAPVRITVWVAATDAFAAAHAHCEPAEDDGEEPGP